MSGALPLPVVLLVEPQFVLRRTIVAVAHDLGIAVFHEATTRDAVRTALAAQRFDGLVVDVSGAVAVADLLATLRQGGCASDPDVPIVALAPPAADGAPDARAGSYGVQAVLHRPFKVAALLQEVRRLMAAGRVAADSQDR